MYCKLRPILAHYVNICLPCHSGEDKAVRYVAQENIEIITPEIPHNLMPLAGRHFKRWDKEIRTFVSNIKDEYPDD